MNPPYEITNDILKLMTGLSEKIGEVNSMHLDRPSPKLRKKNRIKTIKASLEIEGNSLSEEQITAILNNKRVVAPQKDLQEVVNAIKTYEMIKGFKAGSLKSFLKAHGMLMDGLVDVAGKLRTKQVGIFKGKDVSHIAPPAKNLHFLMTELFDYISKSDDHVFIKSCVAHYEIEFIHPFMDGNGRIGRLWQTVILMESYPVFEFLPFETIIKERQEEYYSVLELSDKIGNSTKFIEFMLRAINDAFDSLLKVQNKSFTAEERIEYFISSFHGEAFTRKDYMGTFKDISQATASRDLKRAVEKGLIVKHGDKRNTHYKRK